MTTQEAYALITKFQQIFDVVRLVDAEKTEVCRISADGKKTRQPLHCYEVYHITSKLIEVDGEPFALEIVSKTSDDTLFEAAV